MKTNTNNRRVAASRIALSVLAVLASAAQAQTVAEWDLPKQPLADSLREVAARTDSNIIFDKTLVAGQSARPLKIRASADEALTQLLEGTGLTYRHLDDRTVTIQSISASQKSTSLAGSGDGRIRLAQAETGTATGSPAQGTATVGGKQLIDIEEIIVTGTNIRGIENKTVPVTVLSRQYIESTGYSTTTKLLESITQNFALTNQSGVSIPGVSGSREQGSGINLRGIGEGTTLVLLNGRRLAPGYRSAAVDISALPLSAIERVEILTDGASALYGSDAVGGVVNFILRKDFEGVETRLRGGVADGTDEYRASQAVGNSWDSGNVLVSAEYYKRELLQARDRDFVPSNSLIGSLLPEDENYSGMLTFRQELSGSIGMFAEALHTERDSYNFGGRTTLGEEAYTDNAQTAATLGFDWKFGGDWQIELYGNYARNKLDQDLRARTAAGAPNNRAVESLFEIEGGQIKADGTLFELPGGNVKLAIGGSYRSESFEDSSVNPVNGAITFADDAEQNVRSGFAEVYVPVVGQGNALPGVDKLELSLAGRYDDYSTFGSSTDPQVGLMWEPLGGLRLRGSWGTSYKAPNLVENNITTNSGTALFATDPIAPTAPGGRSYQLQLTGIDVAGLTAQESESSSFGFEIIPESAQGLQLALNYYRIRYTGQVATPQILLANPAAFPGLIIRNPTPDQVNQYIALANLGRGFRAFNINNQPNTTFTPSQVNVIVDARRRNLSKVTTNGVDLAAQYDFGVGGGTASMGLAGTYVLDLDTQVTRSSAEVEAVDTIFDPPHWRARASLGWQSGGFATNLFVNHTDSYTDNRTTVPVSIDAYTTVDARLAYDFSSRFNGGFLSGLSVSLSAQNVLDEDPPKTSVLNTLGDLGFDPTNANPLGRLIALEVTKTW